MVEWTECSLEEIGEIIGGATPSTKREDYYARFLGLLQKICLPLRGDSFQGEKEISPTKGLGLAQLKCYLKAPSSSRPAHL